MRPSRRSPRPRPRAASCVARQATTTRWPLRAVAACSVSAPTRTASAAPGPRGTERTLRATTSCQLPGVCRAWRPRAWPRRTAATPTRCLLRRRATSGRAAAMTAASGGCQAPTAASSCRPALAWTWAAPRPAWPRATRTASCSGATARLSPSARTVPGNWDCLGAARPSRESCRSRATPSRWPLAMSTRWCGWRTAPCSRGAAGGTASRQLATLPTSVARRR
mmetsp:Transcript_43044/g.136822  ORF Transcript_43044/g.136822 Transcript_43044/m.136822 type:complete len:223 (-) Transcript_43044:92-760(-)